jgi:antitoxin (DNA-binding transcriptional repressor) of toxin-antitoxin stability system
MKIAPVKEFSTHTARYVRQREPVLITRRGRLVGFFIPVEDPTSLPWDVRREVLRILAEQLREKAKSAGLTEEEAVARFDAHRKARRQR